MRGIVEKGDGRGRALGYPTANIPLPRANGPSGVWAARVTVKDGEASYMAAVFIDDAREVLESHILDFDDELYGVEIIVLLEKKLRESAQYAHDAELKAAIANDIKQVRAHFKN